MMAHIRWFLLMIGILISYTSMSQDARMTPELLWQLKRLAPVGLTEVGDEIVYGVTTPDVENNSFETRYYAISIKGGWPEEITQEEAHHLGRKISPDGRYELIHKKVKVNSVLSTDYYPELEKSDAYIYHALDYRHWDHWNDGEFNHVFYIDSKTGDTVDIMEGEPFYTPQSPFGGSEDYVWGPDGRSIYYVCKKKEGTEYALSTDTDIYRYDIDSRKTTNITEDNEGYDTQPVFSKGGKLAYLQMKTPGYEADKNDLVVLHEGIAQNLTQEWDGTVFDFIWAADEESLYFTAPTDGTIQLFRVNHPGRKKIAPVVEQISEGMFDVTGIIGETDNKLFVTRTSMNQAAEIYSFDLDTREFEQITFLNDGVYNKLELPKVEKRYVTTTDGKEMLVWVILPPDFDPEKKYPTLLYAQGGPQSPLSQFYSFRWNFQLMASQGYIIVAPNRRGMPGHGVEWNEAISKDWGGLAMKDYLTAIDEVAKEPYVDKDRLGAVGASFGGYSVFYLAGHHEGRFKTFIAHDGVFNTRSMYGTTEELFFVNHDIGGPYWEEENKEAQKTYTDFNPINFVKNWDTPILIIQGGRDYRVPIGQSLEAFQAAQLLGIKSELLYFPDENHWVLQPQNGLVWQRRFFEWLEKTL